MCNIYTTYFNRRSSIFLLFARSERHTARPDTLLLGHDDRAYLADRVVEVIFTVDHQIVELIQGLHLVARHRQPLLHLVRRLGAAPLQTRAQLVEAAGHEKDKHSLWRQTPDRRRA